ncbi:hypothetical protein N7492_001197 [Penicillium capsulatum]|uniref:Uncharacterized protein n=1 Tax=Penicillium capsulatum TaxID=69766 RepID=A0A9W9LZ76_9EURO|nr:hypothetical protein N7492_001197 [Penicillium capsulatum]
MATDPAHPRAQAGDTTDPAPENSEGFFSFTPIKALRSLPRLWERKPSTPFRAGAKSRKLWKRVRSSLGGMKSLESSNLLESDALQSTINASRDSSYIRGVKRQCVAPGHSEEGAGEIQPGRSFLETKWESEGMRKKRKMRDGPVEIYDENLPADSSVPVGRPGNDVGGLKTSTNLDMDGDLAMTSSPVPLPSKARIFEDDMHLENSKSFGDAHGVQSEEPRPMDQQRAMINDAAQNESGQASTTPVVRDLTQEQEGTLVRSALRSSLDGEDTALLNTFLSKAQAKRAAKAVMINSEDADEADKSSSPEESPDAESATPRSRRALANLDANSPSPVKVQVSPLKEGAIPGDESRENEVTKNAKEDEAPASPACRRSARVKAPVTTGPPVRNTIALRRAKGNEFVFLQKTEAQELALTTKRNTRQNKGNSSKSSRKGSSKGSANAPRKRVSWNEERLAEYEDEVQIPDEPKGDGVKGDVDGTSDPYPTAKPSDKKPTTGQRSSRNQAVQNEEVESGPSAPSAATPRSRRVRRLGDSTMASGTPVKTGSGRTSKPPAATAPTETGPGPSTPTKARRKLVPKSPSSSIVPAPTAKGTTGQPFVSGIPTRRPASSNAASLEGTKRKSILQASAGCTPMPKRVRSRT